MNKQQRSILLHRADDNKPIGFDPKIIIGVIKKTSFGDFDNDLDDDYTNIIIDSSDQQDVYYVNESVEKVFDMLNKVENNTFGFIKLHEADDNAVCLLNYTYINVYEVDNDENCTTITIAESEINLKYIDVNESPEKIHQMLMEAFSGPKEKNKK